MKKLILAITVILSVSFFTINASAKLKVIYPNVNSGGKDFYSYAVLKLALENSGEEFDLQILKGSPNNKRVRKMIKEKIISISDFGTSSEFERDFLPIYFPIDMGLNGWRLFLIHKNNQTKFNRINSVPKLQTMIAGQGFDWSDINILKNSGLKTVEVPSINTLFKMVDNQRFDYFPLGANEAYYLLDNFKDKAKNTVVEKNLVLIYPFGRLFFVHKDNIELHDAVKKGLEVSFENGSFMKLFKSHKNNEALFKKSSLKNRKQIHIKNPNMSESFKKIPKKYFFNLDMLD